MSSSHLVHKAQMLTDVELALLLSLIADEHCIVETEEDLLDSLSEETQLIASNTFGLRSAIIECNATLSLDEFTNGLLIDVPVEDASLTLSRTEVDVGEIGEVPEAGPRSKSSGKKPAHQAHGLKRAGGGHTERRLANIIILKSLNLADYQVQIQALELLRTKRIFTHTAVHAAPKPFLVVILKSALSSSLNKHLVDHIFISHYHAVEDGFANLEDASEWIEDDRSSSSSVVRRSIIQNLHSKGDTAFTENDVQTLKSLTSNVTTTPELKSYLQNIVTFLRLHRAVRGGGGGMTPRATIYFDQLVKCLATIHGLDFVTPSLVALGARKIYRHRIVITSPERERSMQYGSDLAAVRAVLEGMTPEGVIEDVLGSVDTPL